MRFLTTMLLTLVFTASTALAELAREITWDDLVPPAPPLENPFAALTVDQRDDLGFIARVRADRKLGFVTEVSPEFEEAVERRHRLKGQGIDADGLLAQAEKMREAIAARNAAVVGSLDGRMVRMPGYALPLEFAGTGVTEFLLVPYVGACIHSPPPPPNQIVLVRLNQTYVADDLYAPVWITGRMKVVQSTSSLSFVDGQAPVAAGYTLEGIKVEPYTQ